MERTDRDRLLLAGTFLELDGRVPKAKTAIEAYPVRLPGLEPRDRESNATFGTIRLSSLVPEHDADARSAARRSVQAEPTRLAIGEPVTPSIHPRWLAPAKQGRSAEAGPRPQPEFADNPSRHPPRRDRLTSVASAVRNPASAIGTKPPRRTKPASPVPLPGAAQHGGALFRQLDTSPEEKCASGEAKQSSYQTLLALVSYLAVTVLPTLPLASCWSYSILIFV